MIGPGVLGRPGRPAGQRRRRQCGGRPVLARSRAKYTRESKHLFLLLCRCSWQEKAHVATTQIRPTPSRGGRGVKILLVDHEQDALELVSRTFLRAGYDVLTAPSGEHALKLMASAQPDLVVL